MCSESLDVLKQSLETQRQMLAILSKPKQAYIATLYDGLCSSINTVRKSLFADDTTLPQGTLFSRVTIKVRSLGTNTYIGLGAAATPGFRLTGINQAQTFIAPIVNSNTVPFLAQSFIVLGDGADGVLEITGIKLEVGKL